MSNTNCCVPQCSSVKKKNLELSFHQFPKDEKLKKAWILVLKIGKKVSKRMCVCSKHFQASDFSKSKHDPKRMRLKTHCIPSQYLPVSSVVVKSSMQLSRQREDRKKRYDEKIFPKDKSLREAWLVASQRLDFVPTKYSYFCSEHFTEDQFNRTQKGCRLRPNAVPTVFHVNSKVKGKAPAPVQTPSEIQPTIKIEPKQQFEVKNTPKKVFPVQPRIRILPKQAKAPVTIAPKPLVNNIPLAPNPIIDLSSIADTIVNSNLIQAAVSAYRQSTNSNMSQQQPTPVSIYVVHPQPNGSNIVTIPSVQDAGSVSTQNRGSLSSSHFQPATSSKSQGLDNYEDRLKNIQKIRRYENRITKYRKDIKILQVRHQKQQSKIEKLKNIIKDLRSANWVGDDESDEEDISEDMSEDEIYAELLKQQQTVESRKEDFSNDGNSDASV